MECYFLETQKWKRCADLQVPRSGIGVVSLHMRVYVIGGRHNTKSIKIYSINILFILIFFSL